MRDPNTGILASQRSPLGKTLTRQLVTKGSLRACVLRISIVILAPRNDNSPFQPCPILAPYVSLPVGLTHHNDIVCCVLPTSSNVSGNMAHIKESFTFIFEARLPTRGGSGICQAPPKQRIHPFPPVNYIQTALTIHFFFFDTMLRRGRRTSVSSICITDTCRRSNVSDKMNSASTRTTSPLTLEGCELD